MKFFKFEHYANSKRNTKFRLLVRPYFVQHLWMIVFCFFWGRESRIVIFWMMMTFGCRSSPPKRIGHLGSIFNQSQKFRYLTWEIRKKRNNIHFLVHLRLIEPGWCDSHVIHAWGICIYTIIYMYIEYVQHIYLYIYLALFFRIYVGKNSFTLQWMLICYRIDLW